MEDVPPAPEVASGAQPSLKSVIGDVPPEDVPEGRKEKLASVAPKPLSEGASGGKDKPIAVVLVSQIPPVEAAREGKRKQEEYGDVRSNGAVPESALMDASDGEDSRELMDMDLDQVCVISRIALVMSIERYGPNL